MRKAILLAGAAAVAMAFGSSIAKADESSYKGVDVVAWVNFDKKRYVNVNVHKTITTKIVVFNYHVLFGHTGAESHSVSDQLNYDNDVWGSAYTQAQINHSVNQNVGITQVNQDAGNMVNQANTLSVAVAKKAFFADASVSAQQVIDWSRVDVVYSSSNATISGSISKNEGVTMVNQNSGNVNNQKNSVSLAIGGHSAVALSESDLGQWVTGSGTNGHYAESKALITRSVNANKGITTVNQSSGNLNNQGTTISVSGSAKF